MKGISKVTLMGNVVENAVVNGDVGKFRLAVNVGSGETLFITCVAFGSMASIVNGTLKGDRVFVEGALRSKTVEKHTFYVAIQEFRNLGKPQPADRQAEKPVADTGKKDESLSAELSKLGLELKEENGLTFVKGKTYGKGKELKRLGFEWSKEKRLWILKSVPKAA